MKTLKPLLYLFLLAYSFNGFSQKISSEKLELIRSEVQSVLGDDWFLTPTESGFKVTFCRSCQKRYVDSCNSNELTMFLRRSRDSFFSPDKADSVCYYTTVSNPPHPFYDDKNDSIRHLAMLETYIANGILSFEIRIEKKWSDKKVQEIAARNDTLKTEILKEPLYKTSMDIFSDYRFWLPDEYLKQRTKKYSFYFERLPYSSEGYDYSIFIIQDKPYYFCSPLYVDKNDRYFYDNISNELENERRRTLKIIALALGILDFKVIN